jgi:hypothetical protein
MTFVQTTTGRCQLDESWNVEGIMGRLIVRFESLAIEDEVGVSVIHFQVEDDHTVHRCRARVVESATSVDVGRVEGYRGPVDHATFAREVERVYREQVELVARIANIAQRESCIVALRERDLVIEREDRLANAG